MFILKGLYNSDIIELYNNDIIYYVVLDCFDLVPGHV